jgi:hypothetical protein
MADEPAMTTGESYAAKRALLWRRPRKIASEPPQKLRKVDNASIMSGKIGSEPRDIQGRMDDVSARTYKVDLTGTNTSFNDPDLNKLASYLTSAQKLLMGLMNNTATDSPAEEVTSTQPKPDNDQDQPLRIPSERKYKVEIQYPRLQNTMESIPTNLALQKAVEDLSSAQKLIADLSKK